MPDIQLTLSQQLFDFFFHKMSLILLICVSIRTSSQFSKETANENIECNKGKGEKEEYSYIYNVRFDTVHFNALSDYV